MSEPEREIIIVPSSGYERVVLGARTDRGEDAEALGLELLCVAHCRRALPVPVPTGSVPTGSGRLQL